VALSGVDKVVSKTATLMDADTVRPGVIAYPIRPMKFSVAPIVAYSVKCKNGADLPAFNTGLQKLAKADSLVQIRFDDTTKETLIVGSGELHLEILLGDLKTLAKGIELVVGKPSVSLRETCVSVGAPNMCKSSNKHNRVHVIASPLPEAVVEQMERGEAPRVDKKLWAAGYSVSDAAECGFNQLLDESKAVEYLFESKGPFVDAFKRLSQNGPLCGEQVRGVQLGIQDAKLHADRAHRGGGELMEMSRRAFSGAIMLASPRLMEPMLRVSIEAPSSMGGIIYGFIAQRRGLVVHEEPREGLPLSIWTAIVPAIEAFGLDSKGFPLDLLFTLLLTVFFFQQRWITCCHKR
jgi:elongation factor 2